jgi:hypothetical protein
MSVFSVSRRRFLSGTGALAGVELAGANLQFPFSAFILGSQDQTRADYTLHIKTSPIEIAPKRIVSAITYNGQFPGPLLRLKEGRQVTVDIYNDTDTAEQLHWHGQKVSVDVVGAAEEGTPFIPAGQADSPSRPVRPGSGSITRTWEWAVLRRLAFLCHSSWRHLSASLVGVGTERHTDMQLLFRRRELAFNYAGIVVLMLGKGNLGFICPYNLELWLKL